MTTNKYLLLIIGILLLVTIAYCNPADASLVWYESNQVEDDFTVLSPLIGENCTIIIIPGTINTTVMNHANGNVEGRMEITVTGGRWIDLGFTEGYALCTWVHYRGPPKLYCGFSPDLENPPSVTKTFDCKRYGSGETNHKIHLMDCQNQCCQIFGIIEQSIYIPGQVVEVCWEVVPCEE